MSKRMDERVKAGRDRYERDKAGLDYLIDERVKAGQDRVSRREE